MARRRYSSVAARTTLASPITNVATSLVVTAAVGYPGTMPFTIIVDADTVNEEVLEVTGVAGTTFTVTRGVDSTTAVAHSAGAVVQHGVSARDFDEANAHVNDVTTDVHSQYMQPATGVMTRGVVGATTGTVTTSSNVASNVQVIAATGTTTSASNFRIEFQIYPGQNYFYQSNLASDVFPAGLKASVLASPKYSTLKISNAANTDWRSFTPDYKSSTGAVGVELYDGALSDMSTLTGSSLTNLSLTEAANPGCYYRLDWAVYTLVTSISNLDVLMAADPFRVLTIGGVVYPKDSYTVSGGTITLTYTAGLSIPVTTAVALSTVSQPLSTGTGGTGTYTLGFQDNVGFTVNGANSKVELGSDVQSGLNGSSTFHEALKVRSANTTKGAAVVIHENNGVANALPRLVVRSAGSTDGLAALPLDYYSGLIDFQYWDGSYWQTGGKLYGGSGGAVGQSYMNLSATQVCVNNVNVAPITTAWTSFTPTVSGTGWAYGNATSSSSYLKVGKTVFYRIIINWGSTSTFGTGNLIIGGFPAGKATNLQHAGAAAYNDQSAALTWSGYTNLQGTNLECYNVTTGSRTAVINTLPFTWANGDSLFANGTYEAA